MDRKEALDILGLPAEASADDIKTAYKEAAQILHPDRFAGNKKLQARATEQFKTLQEAYTCLTKGGGSSRASGGAGYGSGAGAGRAGGAGGAGASGHARPSYYSPEDAADAKLAAIRAAKSRYMEERDALCDTRRNTIVVAVVTGVAAFFFGRRPYGVFGAIAGVAVATAVGAVTKLIATLKNIDALSNEIAALRKEEKRILAELDEEDGEDDEDAESDEVDE